MWRTIFGWLFRKRDSRSPAVERAIGTPMRLPPARIGYRLFKCADGIFDIYDGDELVGDLCHQQRGGDHKETVWTATLYNAPPAAFKTVKLAKDWLGRPPVLRRRPDKTPVA